MNLVRLLHQTAAASGSIYKIVFTGLMLYELIRFRTKRKGYAEDPTFSVDHRRYRNSDASRLKKGTKK